MLFRKKTNEQSSEPQRNSFTPGQLNLRPSTPAPTSFHYFEVRELIQGTEIWRTWRKGVIGASDAPVIMRENRWSSPEFLMEEKLGLREEFTGNAATREGNQLEATARRMLATKYNIELKPTVIQDGKLPFIAASLDAIDSSHSQVFEIKCGEKAYSLAAARRSVPTYYFGQLQHILMVSQLDKIIYAAFRPQKPLVLIEVPRNDQYISRLRLAEEEFADQLVNRGHRWQSEFRGDPINRFS